VAVKIRRTYKGAAVSAVLDSSGVTSATQTSITLSTSPTTWPTGKFFAVFAPGTAQEEKMCVTVSGATLTVVDPAVSSTSASANGRGVDNTTARTTIAGGATVYPVFTAVDADEANELTSTYSAQGHLVYQGASTFSGLGIGTAGQVLKVNSGATAPEWGQVATAGIADSAVTSAKIADATIAAGDLAAAAKKLLCPVGTISAYGGATAPTGWLLCNGDAIDGAYTELIALVGANTPDMKGRFPLGDNASLTLLATGGSTTIAEGNLPAHSHAVGTLATASALTTHTHGVGTLDIAVGGSHSHTFSDTTGDTTQAATQGFEGTGAAAAFLTNTNVDAVSSTANLSVHSHSFSGTTSTASDHDHSISGSTASTDLAHTHSLSGSTATTGSGTAYYQPYLVVNFIIKHDY
jgi:microcystin-dependent protein